VNGYNLSLQATMLWCGLPGCTWQARCLHHNHFCRMCHLSAKDYVPGRLHLLGNDLRDERFDLLTPAMTYIP